MFSDLKCICYYRNNAAQEKFWTDWHSNLVQQDFHDIRSFGANAVRIAIWPGVTKLENWWKLLALARETNLRVKVALALTSEQSDSDIINLFSSFFLPLSSDKDIVAIDLWNEMPLTQGNLDKARVLLPFLKQIARSIPITVSCTHNITNIATIVETLGDYIDYIEYHFYPKQPAVALATLSKIKQLSSHFPVLIGETGFSTYSREEFSDNWLQYEQKKYINHIAWACEELGYSYPGLWCYSDYTNDAFLQSKALVEYYYGVFRTNNYFDKMQALEYGIIDKSFNENFLKSDHSYNLPVYWRRWQQDKAQWHYIKESGLVGIGQSNPVTLSSWYCAPIEQPRPGQEIKASCVARGINSTGTNRIALAFYDTNSKWIDTIASRIMLLPGNMERILEVTALFPPNAAYVEIHLQSANNTGICWFSNVQYSIK